MEQYKNFPVIHPPQVEERQDDQGVTNLKYAQILQKSFIYLMVGRPGSGKSHLINQMILRDDLYKKQFHKIVYISPSRIHKDICVDDDFHAQFIDEDHILHCVDLLTEVATAKPGRRINVLFVFDDCVSGLRDLRQRSIVTNLFFNRRHVIPNCNISIIVTTQQLRAISAQIRAVVTGMFLFSPSPAELDIIKSELIFDKAMIKQAALIITKYFNAQLNQFIFIQLHPTVQLYYNFLKVL